MLWVATQLTEHIQKIFLDEDNNNKKMWSPVRRSSKSHPSGDFIEASL